MVKAIIEGDSGQYPAKIAVSLDEDEDIEIVGATDLGDGRFRVEEGPVFRPDVMVGDIVNVARGHEASILHIAELLPPLVGRHVPVVHETARPGDVDRHFADIAKARRLFGFEPRVQLEEGLARTVEWFRANDIASRAPAEAAGAPNW